MFPEFLHHPDPVDRLQSLTYSVGTVVSHSRALTILRILSARGSRGQ